jgi:hypothetical protein
MPKGGFLAHAQRRVEAFLKRVSTLSGIASLLETRWYLLLRTIPKMLVGVALRFFCAEVLGIEVFSADIVNGFSQSPVFVLAILISGVLEDYKESEGMPATLASEVEGISEQLELCVLLSASEHERSGAAALHGPVLHTECLQLLEAIFSFLASLSGDREALSAISSHSRLLAARLTHAGFGDQAGAIMEHAQTLRSLVNRMYVIKRESSAPAAPPTTSATYTRNLFYLAPHWPLPPQARTFSSQEQPSWSC